MYSYRNNPDIAEKWISKTIEVAKAAGDNRFIAAALFQFGNYYLHIGSYQLAKDYYTQSIAPMEGNQSGLSMIHENLALIAHHQNDVKACMDNFKIAFNCLKKIDATEQQQYGLNSNYATALANFGMYEESLKIRLEMINSLDENDQSHYNPLAFTYQGLADIYRFLNKPKKALEYSKLNLHLRKKQSNQFQQSLAHLVLADAYVQNKQSDLATKEIKKGIALCEKMNDKVNLGKCYFQLANILFTEQKFKEALQYTTNAIALHEQTDYEVSMVLMHLLITEINLEFNDIDAAHQSINKAFEYLKHNEILAESKKANYLMSVVKYKTGDYKAAFEYANKEKEFIEKITKKENSKLMANMDAKYETAKKEQEAQQLKLDKVTFQQKALRAQMNPHFIFNSLNSIQKFISAKEHKSASIFLASFSKLMRQILENSDEEFNALDDVITFLEEYLRLEQMRFEHNFTFQITVDDEVEEDIMKIPSMIIQPYVENAILHGINAMNDGRINVDFAMFNDDTILCVITDNGKGLEQSKKLVKKKNHKSMGTRITKDRIKALAAKYNKKVKVESIDLYESGKKGTQVKIYLPIL